MVWWDGVPVFGAQIFLIEATSGGDSCGTWRLVRRGWGLGDRGWGVWDGGRGLGG